MVIRGAGIFGFYLIIFEKTNQFPDEKKILHPSVEDQQKSVPQLFKKTARSCQGQQTSKGYNWMEIVGD